MESVHKILLLRPNYRIGNTLCSTPLIRVMRKRFPTARLDYLGADTTAVLLQNLPLDKVVTVSRSQVLRPWRFMQLLYRLRRERYDLVVATGNGSFSDMICMAVLNARYRMGSGKWAEGVCNIKTVNTDYCHAYDLPVEMAHLLGTDCRDRPLYVVSQQENDKAVLRLSEIGLRKQQRTLPFAALFVGGHKNKRWPLESWEELVRRLRELSEDVRILILLGPEETAMGEIMKAKPQFHSVPFIDPLPLRDFAALLQQACLVVTPDTGPMHLSVALDVPTIAVLQSKKSLPYAPRGENDVCLLNPTVAQVAESVRTHSRWSHICSRG